MPVLMVNGLRVHRAGLDVDDHWNTQLSQRAIEGPGRFQGGLALAKPCGPAMVVLLPIPRPLTQPSQSHAQAHQAPLTRGPALPDKALPN